MGRRIFGIFLMATGAAPLGVTYRGSGDPVEAVKKAVRGETTPREQFAVIGCSILALAGAGVAAMPRKNED